MSTIKHERYLTDITNLPTAAGREGQVIAYIENWVKRQKSVTLKRDAVGNLLLQRKGARSQSPVVFTAHLDHPAFVITQVQGKTITAEFRGGVHESYFVGTRVKVWPSHATGKVVAYEKSKKKYGAPTITVELTRKNDDVKPGQVMTWKLPESKIKGKMLVAPACDDLAGVAAGLATFEKCLKLKQTNDVRLLLTRAEEFGFLGAIAVAKSGWISKKARLICLENSKAFEHAPIGAGPIVRVGDRSATFTPDLTYRVGQVAQKLWGPANEGQWQRKLMDGGTCEASVFHAMGYQATCLCLPLGNYHNMNEATGKIDSERINVNDYHALIKLMIQIGKTLDNPSKAPAFTQIIDDLYAARSYVLQEK